MKICPNCGFEITNERKYCPECGANLSSSPLMFNNKKTKKRR